VTSTNTNPVKTYDRKCKDWLDTWIQWVAPLTEAPETFIVWTGLFTLASALRQRVWFPKKYLGKWDIAPNLYIFFVAPSGKRKTTAADQARELIDEITDITQGPDIPSKEFLFSTIVNSPDASMSINAGEWSEFIMKSGPDMYSFLTNAYDRKKRLSAGTQIRGIELAEKPVVNIVAAITPEGIVEYMPQQVIGGGFASRVIFVYEEDVRRRQMFYRKIILEYGGEAYFADLRQRLIDDLAHISKNLAGQYELENEELEDWFEHWYQATAGKVAPEHVKLTSYFERKPAHIIKVAMLLRAAQSDELTLTRKDFDDAMKIVEMTEKKMPLALKSVGKNPYTIDMDNILDFIRSKGTVKLSGILSQYYGRATPNILKELVNGLVDRDVVTMTLQGVDILYTYKPNTNGLKTVNPSQLSASQGHPQPETPSQDH
jgi:hypothetical protein